jgi:hypothetical protein
MATREHSYTASTPGGAVSGVVQLADDTTTMISVFVDAGSGNLQNYVE